MSKELLWQPLSELGLGAQTIAAIAKYILDEYATQHMDGYSHIYEKLENMKGKDRALWQDAFKATLTVRDVLLVMNAQMERGNRFHHLSPASFEKIVRSHPNEFSLWKHRLLTKLAKRGLAMHSLPSLLSRKELTNW